MARNENSFTIHEADISTVIDGLARGARENTENGLWETAIAQWLLASRMYRALGHHGLAARYARNAMALQDRIEAAKAPAPVPPVVDWMS